MGDPTRREGKTIQGYYIEKHLSSGAFGDVYKATKRVRGKQLTYALKIFDLSRRGAVRDMDNETEAYRIVSQDPRCQKYIICMYDSFKVGQEGGIALEFMEGGDLNRMIRKYPHGIQSQKLVMLMRDLLMGLAFVHSKGIGHRDIKPGNILSSDDEWVFKVADMGGGCGFNLQQCTAWGTLCYLPPELARVIRRASSIDPSKALNQPISVQAAQRGDIWALGLVFWEMAFGKGQYPADIRGKTSDEVIVKVSKILNQSQVEIPRYSKNIGHVSFQIINKILLAMLQVNPNARGTAAGLRDYLVDEMKGCSARGRTLSRAQIEDMGKRNSELGAFLQSKGYHTNMNLSTLCSFLREYFFLKKPPRPVPRKPVRGRPGVKPQIAKPRRPVRGRPPGVRPRSRAQRAEPKPEPVKVVTDHEIINQALQECGQKGKPFACDKRRVKAAARLLKNEGGIPRSREAHRRLQNHHKDKKRLGSCILCLYLSYRKVAMDKGEPDPGFPAEVRPFKCSINNKNIPTADLRVMAQTLGIPHQGVSKNILCKKVYVHLLSKKKISKGMLARDILEGIRISARDDVISGITGADPKKAGNQSRDQRQMIDAILDIAKLGGSESINVPYIQTQKISILRDLERLEDKTYLAKDQKTRAAFLQREVIYIDIVLGVISKWSV